MLMATHATHADTWPQSQLSGLQFDTHSTIVDLMTPSHPAAHCHAAAAAAAAAAVELPSINSH